MKTVYSFKFDLIGVDYYFPMESKKEADAIREAKKLSKYFNVRVYSIVVKHLNEKEMIVK